MNKIIVKQNEVYYLGLECAKSNVDKKSHVLVMMGNNYNTELKLTHKIVWNHEIQSINNLDDVKTRLMSDYIDKIKYETSRLKSTTASDYQDSVEDEYDRLVKIIMNTAKNMVADEKYNDDSFENRLKEICQLKKQLFSIPNEGVKDARKHNGKVKYKIKEIKKEFEKQMRVLDVVEFNELIGG